MPEGHTIHRLALDHNREFVGQKLAITSPQGRFADGAKVLNRKTLKLVHAHGKHLCYEFTGHKWLHIHLGLYGKFRRHDVPPPAPRGAVRLRVIGENKAFDLNGPTKCELLSKKAWLEIQNRLGPDPLRDDADPEQAWRRIQASRQAMGKLLLDQSVIAGVGNVFRAEVLYLLRIHPERAGKDVSRAEFEMLWAKLVQLLEAGVRHNRIITANFEPHAKLTRSMRRSERLLIYKRRTCSQCGGRVNRWTLGARTAYACDTCQV